MNKHAPSQHHARKLAADCLRLNRAERRNESPRTEHHAAHAIISQSEQGEPAIVFPSRGAQ